MALDFLVMYMASGKGLLIILAGLCLPVLLWRAVLWDRFSRIGYRPYVLSYVVAVPCYLVACFVGALLNYLSRIENYPNAVPDIGVIPGWTLYLAFLQSMSFVILLGLCAVPLAAILRRYQKSGFRYIIGSTMAGFIGATIYSWASWSNLWREAHPLHALLNDALELLPWFVIVAFPLFWCSLRASGRPQKDSKSE